ncbi:unnamed protein product [Rhodiola kirilowii]
MNRKPALSGGSRVSGTGGGRRVSERLAKKNDLSEEDLELRSRLLKKLASLEERAARIAFDIKRVKEMLDDDNISQYMLLDIEEKILAFERAMGYVGGDSAKDVEYATNEVVGGGDGNVTNKVTTLNQVELEKRFFPHQRLLRERKLKSDEHEKEKLEANVADHMLGSRVSEEQISMPSVTADKQDSMKSENVAMEICDGQIADNCDILEMQAYTDLNEKHLANLNLTTSETLDENDSQCSAHVQTMVTDDETEESSGDDLHQIGVKVSTAGWFVSKGEFALLAHDDGCCSLYDIVNCEEKAEYRPPDRVPMSIWGDCWIMRVAGIDGCVGKYVVAASAGNTKVSGFCSWDFYSKTVHACHLEDELPPSRTLSHNSRRHIRDVLPPNNAKWWYKPCGPLIVATASSQQTVKVFDVRDGEQVMKFEIQLPISSTEYCSPLQWRAEGRVVLAQLGRVSLWDLNSRNPQPLVSVYTSEQKITALHIFNSDDDMSEGVRKRATRTDAVGNDGVFCTGDFITILDFRDPCGVGLKIPISGFDSKSVFSYGDTVLLGGSQQQSAGKRNSSQVQHFSLRQRRPVATYPMPESNSQSNITQVWGDSALVMAVSSLGLGMYGTFKDRSVQSSGSDSNDNTQSGSVQSWGSDYNNNTQTQSEVSWGSDYNITQRGVLNGPSDMYNPSFDYALSRTLLISRDRPAVWQDLA